MKGERWLGLGATLVAAFGVALAGLYPGSNPDTFGHLAQGRQIVALGGVPPVDNLSLLPGAPRPWHNYEWLSDLGSYLLYDFAGYPAVTVVKCALLVGTVLALAGFSALLGGPRASVLTSIALVSTIPAIRIRLSDRPHVLGIFLAALYLLALGALVRMPTPRIRTAIIVGIALSHVIWVNAHGSHLLGVAITGSFLLFGPREARRWVALVLLFEGLASCVSPYGPAIVIDAVAHVFDPRYRQIVSEWLPWREIDPAWLQIGPALHGAVLTLLAPRLLRGVPTARAAALVALLLGIASFRSIRFVAEFMLLSSPLIGVGLSALSAQVSTRRFVACAAPTALAIFAAAALGARSLPPHVGIGLAMRYDGLPIASAKVLRDYVAQPRLLASIQDSWFTMFAAPNARFAVDGRVPFYGPDHIARVSEAFASEAAFRALVSGLGINAVIAGHAYSEDRQLGRFALRAGFSLRMIEDQHALYLRDDALDAETAVRVPKLRALWPSYDMGWILAADGATVAALQAELATLARHPGTHSFAAWVEGVLTLSPLRRGKPSDGFRWPRDAADWARYRAALPKIEEAARAAGAVPVVSALHAYVAAVLCDFDRAERALAQALGEGASREPLLAMQELRLREGRVAEVRDVIDRARKDPQGRDDAWLAELAGGVDATPSCPP